MKNLFLLLFSVGFLLAPAFLQANNTGHKLEGKWNYEVPNAPDGYQKGAMTFAEKDGVLTGEIIFSDGYKLPLKNLKVEDGELSGGLYIEGEYISFKMNIEAGAMKGKVSTPDGALDIAATKE